MTDYKEILQKAYEDSISYEPTEYASPKLLWIANIIFDINTYDDEVDCMFGSQMLETIDALLKGKVYEYIEENYITYLTMTHFPFLKDKLDWGDFLERGLD